MGLARIAIAVLAVVLAFGLLILGGIALWGALTGKDDKSKPNSAASPVSGTATSTSTSGGQASAPAGRGDNTITVHCMEAQCPVFVSGPTADDVQYHGNLNQGDTRVWTGTRVTVAVEDAGGVAVTINGRAQRRGARGMAKTYEAGQ